MKRYNTKKGFSLIELMIVLAITFFIISCIITTYRFLDRTFVRAELYFFKIFCQKVRSDAIATGVTQNIEIDPITNSYHTGETLVQLPTQVQLGAAHGAWGPPSAPTTPISQSVTFKNNTIVCYPDGIVSSGIVYFTDKEKDTGYALSNGVSSLCYLRLYRYNNGKWVVID